MAEKLKGSESIKGQFLRGADFSYKDFMECPNLKVVYVLAKDKLKAYRAYITKGFYGFLEEKADGNK